MNDRQQFGSSSAVQSEDRQTGNRPLKRYTPAGLSAEHPAAVRQRTPRRPGGSLTRRRRASEVVRKGPQGGGSHARDHRWALNLAGGARCHVRARRAAEVDGRRGMSRGRAGGVLPGVHRRTAEVGSSSAGLLAVSGRRSLSRVERPSGGRGHDGRNHVRALRGGIATRAGGTSEAGRP